MAEGETLKRVLWDVLEIYGKALFARRIKHKDREI